MCPPASSRCCFNCSALSSRVTVVTIYLLSDVCGRRAPLASFPTHLQTERADLAERALLSHQGDQDILQHHRGTGLEVCASKHQVPEAQSWAGILGLSARLAEPGADFGRLGAAQRRGGTLGLTQRPPEIPAPRAACTSTSQWLFLIPARPRGHQASGGTSLLLLHLLTGQHVAWLEDTLNTRRSDRPVHLQPPQTSACRLALGPSLSWEFQELPSWPRWPMGLSMAYSCPVSFRIW